jgi:hypothetical protein
MCVMLVVSLAFLRVAGAQEQPANPAQPVEPAVQQALEHYERGIRFYENDAFGAALIEFRKAYELAPQFRVHYNIAQVCFELKDYVCALRSFEDYLNSGGSRVPNERRAEVEKEIATLRTLVAHVIVETNVPGVAIAIDDVVVGTTPLASPIMVAAGRRKISAAKQGLFPITRAFDIPSGTESRVRFEMKPPVPIATAPRTAKSAAEQEPGPRFTTLSWIGMGSGVALLAGAGVCGVLALDKNSRFQDSPHATEEAGESSHSKAQNLALASDLLLGAGLVTLGTTLVLTFTRPRGPAPHVALTMTPGSISASGRF